MPLSPPAPQVAAAVETGLTSDLSASCLSDLSGGYKIMLENPKKVAAKARAQIFPINIRCHL
jgi:hypothetical protein